MQTNLNDKKVMEKYKYKEIFLIRLKIIDTQNFKWVFYYVALFLRDF